MAWAPGPIVLALSKDVQATVHAMPCTIKRTGPAPVSSYFLVSETGDSTDERTVLQSTFRGRGLRGVKIDLPEGFTGVVLARDEAVTVGVKAQRVVKDFKSFTVWNHDVNPTSTDLLPRAVRGVRRTRGGVGRCHPTILAPRMQWLPVARELHRPVGVDEVQAALSELRQLAGEKRKREAGAA